MGWHFLSLKLLVVFFGMTAWGDNAIENCATLPQNVQSVIDANTFMYIPINTYATTYDVKTAAAIFQKNCMNPNLPLSGVLNCKALQSCASPGCKAPYLDHGTAFLVGDGRTLYTAWHVAGESSQVALIMFGHLLSNAPIATRERAYRQFRPEFLLADSKANIVYDSRKDSGTEYENIGDPIQLLYAEKLLTPEKVYGAFESSSKDFTGIRLTRSLGSGIPLANKTPLGSECLYSLSYQFDGTVSQLASTSGHVVRSMTAFMARNPNVFGFSLRPLQMDREKFEKQSIREILQAMNYSEGSIDAQVKEFSEAQLRAAISTVLDAQAINLRDIEIYDPSTTVLTTQPILPGGSGSPMVNGSGQVVSLVTNALFQVDPKGLPEASYGAVGVLLNTVLNRGFYPRR